MSRTRKGTKSPGAEHWKSRLNCGGDSLGKKTKVITHQRERAIAKRELLTELEQMARDIADEHEELLERELNDWDLY